MCMWGILIPVSLASLLAFETFRTRAYVLPAAGVVSFALFTRYPWLVRRIHGRPLYYEDLEDDRWVDPLIRFRFQHAFTRVLMVLNAAGVVLLAQYGWSAAAGAHHPIEVLGVLGGLYTLHQKIVTILGKLLLKLLARFRESEDGASARSPTNGRY